MQAKAKLGKDFTIANPDGFHPNWAGSMAMVRCSTPRLSRRCSAAPAATTRWRS